MSDPTPPLSSTLEFQRPIEVFVVHPYRPRYWVHILLLATAFLTMLVVGARMQFNFNHDLAPFAAGNEYITYFPIEWALGAPSRLLMGVPFAASLMLILLAHEMGHYVYCRRYHVQATLPFFIPAPTLIGTLGAVIRIKSPIRSRAALFDIGIAGPIAGFVVAVVVLAISLSLSKPLPLGAALPPLAPGYSYVFKLMYTLIHPAGIPLQQLNLHPMGIAAWVGMYATMLNLLPSGQLDGGHMVYALWPRAHRAVSWVVVLGLAYLGWRERTWLAWALLVTAMNIITRKQRQAPDYPGIKGTRWWLALLGLAMLILTFLPVPFYGLDAP